MQTTTDTDNPTNQSELEANTCNWHQAPENACEKVTIGFGFTSDCLAMWRKMFSQSQSIAEAAFLFRVVHCSKLSRKKVTQKFDFID